MEKYPFQIKPYKLITFVICFTAFSFAQELSAKPSDTIQVFTSDECESLFCEYYRTQTIGNEHIRILTESLGILSDSLDTILSEAKSARDIRKQNELLILYLKHAEIISTIYNSGGINGHDEIISKTDTDLKKSLRLSGLENEVYLKYADYLYTKLFDTETKRFNINLTLPVLYRKILAKDKTNKTALVKLSCWQISSADELTSNFNSQIKETEKYIEELHEIDKFNAYIRYSMFYMKIYNTKKGWEYFYKAQNLFPSHPLTSMLYENYQKGIFKL